MINSKFRLQINQNKGKQRFKYVIGNFIRVDIDFNMVEYIFKFVLFLTNYSESYYCLCKILLKNT